MSSNNQKLITIQHVQHAPKKYFQPQCVSQSDLENLICFCQEQSTLSAFNTSNQDQKKKATSKSPFKTDLYLSSLSGDFTGKSKDPLLKLEKFFRERLCRIINSAFLFFQVISQVRASHQRPALEQLHCINCKKDLNISPTK